MTLRLCLGYKGRCRGNGFADDAPRCKPCTSAKQGDSYYQSPEWKRLSKQAKQHGSTCDICGSDHYVTAHHVEGRQAGGADDLKNVRILLCGSCHSSYEAAKRNGNTTDLTREVEALAQATEQEASS